MKSINKQIFLLLIATLILCNCKLTKLSDAGIFIDKRDGKTYRYRTMADGKKWMTQNLNYEKEGSWRNENDENNDEKYGRLYNWESAIKVCPNGWILATDNDWWEMTSYYGKAFNRGEEQDIRVRKTDGKAAYTALEFVASGGDDSGFSAQLGGYHSKSDGISGQNNYGLYWTSTTKSAGQAWYYIFNGPIGRIERSSGDKEMGRSCRCVRD